MRLPAPAARSSSRAQRQLDCLLHRPLLLLRRSGGCRRLSRRRSLGSRGGADEHPPRDGLVGVGARLVEAHPLGEGREEIPHRRAAVGRRQERACDAVRRPTQLQEQLVEGGAVPEKDPLEAHPPHRRMARPARVELRLVAELVVRPLLSGAVAHDQHLPRQGDPFGQVRLVPAARLLLLGDEGEEHVGLVPLGVVVHFRSDRRHVLMPGRLRLHVL
mmetsp:Transcript_9952/g.32954  ORF Transcript_9952/g.32954 Transcript_9952/m.32954 type:complete len:217 (+) Transcript_9952:585-1235(+)